ncbi:hypothetical protein ACHZ97_14735 [Lysobacter soli]|uniref:hypothetical protein n=1 Tax=Lysobacter soli TaxID=453783 RepID=UPI0037C76E08
MPAWPPTTEREPPHPANDPGVIDVTEDTIGDRTAVASINEFRARLDAQRRRAPVSRPDRDPPEAA